MTTTVATAAARRLSPSEQLAAAKLALRTALTAGDVATVQWCLYSPSSDLERATRKWLKAKYESRAIAAAERQGLPMGRAFSLFVAAEIADLVAFDLNAEKVAPPTQGHELLVAAMSDPEVTTAVANEDVMTW